MREASTITVFISTSAIRVMSSRFVCETFTSLKRATSSRLSTWSGSDRQFLSLSRKLWADKKDKAPVIDVMKTGYTKVIGKRKPPEHPVIVNARCFTKKAEEKTKIVDGVSVLCDRVGLRAAE